MPIPTASEPTPALPRRVLRETQRTAPHLFVALHCDRPLAQTSAHSLDGVDSIVIGRAPEDLATRTEEAGERRLLLGIADRWLSTSHARLRRQGYRFVLEDAGSKNGTVLNGAHCQSETLANYDVIELGHTLLPYRDGVPVGDGEPADLGSASLPEPAPGLSTFVKPLAEQFGRLELIARSAVSVVISGESGTGKEGVARALHALSGRCGPFVAVSCGAIAPNLLESELFGYRKGAFSGATESRPGLVRSAEGGTLFLDELGDLSLAGQAALLRVLQESEVLAVGATEPVKVDVRVLAATHVSLPDAIANHRFRADLFARLSGFTLSLPPLRWRREDLGLRIAWQLRGLDGGPGATFTPEAASALLRYRWPLNLRELAKCLSSALVLANGQPIDVPHLPAAIEQSLHAPDDGTDPRLDLRALAPKPRPPSRPLDEAEKKHRDELVALLREHKGNVASVARAMGKARMQIHRWVRRYELHLDEFR